MERHRGCANNFFKLSIRWARGHCPRLYRATCFQCHSNDRHSFHVVNPCTWRNLHHCPAYGAVALAPPFTSPWCCRKRRSKFFVAPQYVRRPLAVFMQYDNILFFIVKGKNAFARPFKKNIVLLNKTKQAPPCQICSSNLSTR